MSRVRQRSFTVPKGSKFICVPLDGSGPLIAEAGEQVIITVAETWDIGTRHLLASLVKPEPTDE